MRYALTVNPRLEAEREADGRWLAEMTEIPCVIAYGETPNEARARVKALASHVISDRLEHDDSGLKLGPLKRRRRTLDPRHYHRTKAVAPSCSA